MKIKLYRDYFLMVSLFVLLLGGSNALSILSLESKLESLGYAFFLYLIFYTVTKSIKNRIGNILFFIAILFMFSIGIIEQNMDSIIKVRLIFTMVVIGAVSVLSEDVILYKKTIANISYIILLSCVVNSLLCIGMGNSLLDRSVEGLWSFGFNGGMLYKNFFASDLIAAFIGFALYLKMNIVSKKEKIKIQLIMLTLVLLLFFTNSRGAYIIFIVFLLAFYKEEIIPLPPVLKKIFFLFSSIVIVIVAVLTFQSFALASETYMYRIRGIINYFDYISADWIHLMYGYAELAFADPDVRYVDALRTVLGFDGSFEFAFLNIFIKNGLIGLIGYLLIFARFYIASFDKNRIYGKYMRPILFALIVSALVESYISNVHAFFGVYCYLLLSILGRTEKLK